MFLKIKILILYYTNIIKTKDHFNHFTIDKNAHTKRLKSKGPKTESSVIIFSSSHHSKSIRHQFIFETQMKIFFNETWEIFVPPLKVQNFTLQRLPKTL